MNRPIFDCAVAAARVLAARLRVCAAAFVLPALALVAVPAAAVTNAWAPADPMATARYSHTATLLPSGKVLMAGGRSGSVDTASAELYDPARNALSAAGSLATGRSEHAATLLPSGKVLVIGGRNSGSSLAGVELYDPTTNAWSTAASLSTARNGHTATLLPSGKVLVAGGKLGNGVLASAELYDPATNTWSAVGPLAGARTGHTATLLSSGKVLVAGGGNGTGYPSGAELFDPATNTWSAAGTLITPREGHTATLLASGKVLVAGGYSNGNYLASAQLYDPATNTWTAIGNMAQSRSYHSATLLPSGRVLVAGGYSSGTLVSSELYDPATSTWSAAGNLTTPRRYQAATLLPTGKVLAAGGSSNAGALDSTETYDPAAGSWSAAGALAVARSTHTTTLLPSGQVLAAGGLNPIGEFIADAERYDPATGTWNAAGALAEARFHHTATLLPSGKTLVVGGAGSSGYLASAESYDPVTNTWNAAGALATARLYHTATLLPSGKVLVAGGSHEGAYLASAELYDPATNTWSAAGAMATPRYGHTATLLTSGQVLVVGGDSPFGPLAGVELYDPATNSWSAAGALGTARWNHTATLLPNGKVLVAGGRAGGGTVLASAELYNPVTNVWNVASTLAQARYDHTATLLPSGRVLVVGGLGATHLDLAELYDPARNAWNAAGTLAAGREHHAATLLSSGQVLVTGGENGSGVLADAELHDPGLAPVAALQPDLSTASAFLLQTSALVATSPGSATVADAATATGFMPLRQGGGGSFNQSASNAPVFQLQRIDNEQMRFVPNDGSVVMTDTMFTGSASALADFPAGPVHVRVWVNGVPSVARHSTLAVTPGVPAAPSAAGGVLQASVNFAAVSETGGAPVTSYIATATPGGATASCTAPCTSIVFSPLAPGDYAFTVHAVNAAGEGPESPASNAATVTRPVPALAWPAPGAIVYGTPLDAMQLNATATYDGNPVAGSFTYTPAAGSVLAAGNAQVLSVTFTPADTDSYLGATASVPIDVTPAPLGVTGTSAQNKAYDGTATATLGGGTLVGVLAADIGNVTLVEAGLFAQANVGTAIVVLANDSLEGGAAGNYALAQPTGLHADITPVTLTYTATPATMPYGTTPSGLDGTVSGFIPGESQATATTGTLAFTTTATASSGPGQYPVTGSGLDANDGNYVFVQAAGNATALTIERADQATLNLVATPDLLIPGMTSQLAASGGSGSGAVSYAVDSGPCSIGGSVVSATGVGTCIMRADKAGDANYNAASATATIIAQAANLPVAQALAVSTSLDAALAIQLAGSDDNIGGPYALSFAIADAPAHGTIGGLDASTGTLTYTPHGDYIGADHFSFTVASTHGVSLAATVTIAVTAPPLALQIGDGRAYARYGQVVDYVATLTNAGSAVDDLPVAFTLSDGFDRDSLRLDCFVPGVDAACTQDATDPLQFTVTLQPGRTLTWLASVRVRPDTADDTATFGVVSAAGDISDTNTLVILRDGFDVAGGDGTLAARVVEGEQARAILDADGLLEIVVPASIGAVPTALLVVRDRAREARIEGIEVAGAVFVRLFERAADGGERVSAWSAVEPGVTLTLGSVATTVATDAAPSRALVVAGAEGPIALP